ELRGQPKGQRSSIQHLRQRVRVRERFEARIVRLRHLDDLRALNCRDGCLDHGIGELDILRREWRLVPGASQKEHTGLRAIETERQRDHGANRHLRSFFQPRPSDLIVYGTRRQVFDENRSSTIERRTNFRISRQLYLQISQRWIFIRGRDDTEAITGTSENYRAV